MPKMQKESQKRQTILSSLLIQCRALGERWFRWFRSLCKTNPQLEASHRRYDGRAGVDDFTQRVWDAVKKLPRMEELLRKQPTREEENERVLRKEEENEKRIAKLAQLSQTEGWEIVVSLLRSWENFCYMNLRFPETRKDKVSFEYFIGFQNGALWVIEGLRKEVYGAVISLKKKNALRNKENRE